MEQANQGGFLCECVEIRHCLFSWVNIDLGGRFQFVVSGSGVQHIYSDKLDIDLDLLIRAFYEGCGV